MKIFHCFNFVIRADMHIERSFSIPSVILIWWFIAEHLNPINVKISELKEALESVTAEQKYLKARDARHRHSKLSSFR